MVNYAVCSFTRFFIAGRENANVILSKRQLCERRNFRKIAIFNHNFKNEKIAVSEKILNVVVYFLRET